MMCLKDLAHSGPSGASIYEQCRNKEMAVGNFSRKIRSYRCPVTTPAAVTAVYSTCPVTQEQNVRARQSLTTEGIWV
jgi:hypothetical protein